MVILSAYLLPLLVQLILSDPDPLDDLTVNINIKDNNGGKLGGNLGGKRRILTRNGGVQENIIGVWEGLTIILLDRLDWEMGAGTLPKRNWHYFYFRFYRRTLSCI